MKVMLTKSIISIGRNDVTMKTLASIISFEESEQLEQLENLEQPEELVLTIVIIPIDSISF
ncbi:MAG TPA: hypothetical protein DDY92_01315 [Dialister sp.]|nr:hypothetical protein [Dialister sp.]